MDEELIGNSDRLWRYWRESQRLIFKALNRRSQRKSYNLGTFTQMWKTLGIPNPAIVEKPYNRHHQWTLSYS